MFALIFAHVLVLIAVGSVAFHFWSPWWWTEVASNILRAETAAIAAISVVNFYLDS